MNPFPGNSRGPAFPRWASEEQYVPVHVHRKGEFELQLQVQPPGLRLGRPAVQEINLNNPMGFRNPPIVPPLPGSNTFGFQGQPPPQGIGASLMNFQNPWIPYGQNQTLLGPYGNTFPQPQPPPPPSANSFPQLQPPPHPPPPPPSANRFPHFKPPPPYANNCPQPQSPPPPANIFPQPQSPPGPCNEEIEVQIIGEFFSSTNENRSCTVPEACKLEFDEAVDRLLEDETLAAAPWRLDKVIATVTTGPHSLSVSQKIQLLSELLHRCEMTGDKNKIILMLWVVTTVLNHQDIRDFQKSFQHPTSFLTHFCAVMTKAVKICWDLNDRKMEELIGIRQNMNDLHQQTGQELDNNLNLMTNRQWMDYVVSCKFKTMKFFYPTEDTLQSSALSTYNQNAPLSGKTIEQNLAKNDPYGPHPWPTEFRNNSINPLRGLFGAKNFKRRIDILINSNMAEPGLAIGRLKEVISEISSMGPAFRSSNSKYLNPVSVAVTTKLKWLSYLLHRCEVVDNNKGVLLLWIIAGVLNECPFNGPWCWWQVHLSNPDLFLHHLGYVMEHVVQECWDNNSVKIEELVAIRQRLKNVPPLFLSKLDDNLNYVPRLGWRNAVKFTKIQFMDCFYPFEKKKENTISSAYDRNPRGSNNNNLNNINNAKKRKKKKADKQTIKLSALESGKGTDFLAKVIPTKSKVIKPKTPLPKMKIQSAHGKQSGSQLNPKPSKPIQASIARPIVPPPPAQSVIKIPQPPRSMRYCMQQMAVFQKPKNDQVISKNSDASSLNYKKNGNSTSTAADKILSKRSSTTLALEKLKSLKDPKLSKLEEMRKQLSKDPAIASLPGNSNNKTHVMLSDGSESLDDFVDNILSRTNQEWNVVERNGKLLCKFVYNSDLVKSTKR